MKSIVITFVTIFFGISIANPINKDQNMDDLVLRVNELRRLSPYQDDMKFYVRNLDSIGGGNLLRSLDSSLGIVNADDEANNNGNENDLPSSFYYPNDKYPLLYKNHKKFDITSAYNHRNTYQPSILTQRIVRSLNSVGGRNLIRALDSIGGGHLVKRTIDSLGGANLIRK